MFLANNMWRVSSKDYIALKRVGRFFHRSYAMIGVIIQARTRSSRFPDKIYEDINGKYTLQRVLEGVSESKLAQSIVLAMPLYDEDMFRRRYGDGEFSSVTDERFSTYFGSSDNLIDRYFKAARIKGLSIIVRVTADCPLVQGSIIDEMLFEYLKNDYNGFMGNNSLISKNHYPDGCDVEIFPYWMLAETWQLTKDPHMCEHVTPFMYRRGTEYDIHSFSNTRPNTQISNRFKDFSFDTVEDLKLILSIAKEYDVHKDLNKAIREVVIND